MRCFFVDTPFMTLWWWKPYIFPKVYTFDDKQSEPLVQWWTHFHYETMTLEKIGSSEALAHKLSCSRQTFCNDDPYVRHMALGVFLCRCVARWVPQGVPLHKPSYALAWVIKNAWATSLSCVALWRTFMLLTSCATRDNMHTTICVIVPMEYIQSCHACLAWKGSDAAQGRYGWMEGGEVCGSGWGVW